MESIQVDHSKHFETNISLDGAFFIKDKGVIIWTEVVSRLCLAFRRSLGLQEALNLYSLSTLSAEHT